MLTTTALYWTTCH